MKQTAVPLPLKLVDSWPSRFLLFDAAALLPPREVALARARRLAETAGLRVTKRGRGPGSLEEEATAGLDYTVVDGEAIATLPEAAWLWEWYHQPALWQTLTGWLHESVAPSKRRRSAINLNTLDASRGLPGDARYEWHTDGNRWTGLLFLTTHHPDVEGGALLLRCDGDYANPAYTVAITPVYARLAVFRGDVTPHAVAPLRVATAFRQSIPLVLATAAENAAAESEFESRQRADADAYLFEAESRDFLDAPTPSSSSPSPAPIGEGKESGADAND